MAQFHIRAHETGRIRIWTSDMVAYGQFTVADYKDVETFKAMLDKLGLSEMQVHRCDGTETCKCPILSYGESIADYID